MPSGIEDLTQIRHPNFAENAENYEKWRLTYKGGSRFIRRYLKRFSLREDDQAFRDRIAVSYCPAFAKAAVEEVKNAIFQRLTDIVRVGGPDNYMLSIEGLEGGVDMTGSSMMTFMGRDILPELLTMGRVGIYVDSPPVKEGTTLAERNIADHPYLYFYKVEDIQSWTLRDVKEGDPTEFKALLLRDSVYDINEDWVLPQNVSTRYRYIYVHDDGFVRVRFYGRTEKQVVAGGPMSSIDTMVQLGEEVKLNLKKIPFVLLELSDSLLSDVADYQIALLNLASSDINYALKSNYPFYVEQYDWKSETPYLKPPGPGGQVTTIVADTTQEKVREVKIGTATGRRYPTGTERPGFISPSSEPLRISMAKQEQLKEEIRQLVHLAVASLSATRQSAQSQNNDLQGLEAGLSYIGLELQHAERKIAEFWGMYEGGDGAQVYYPTQYSLLSDEERRIAAAQLKDLLPMVPSITFRREVSKKIVDIVLGSKIDARLLLAIKNEIDKDPVVIGDPSVIEQDVVNGLVDLETASAARGYPKGTVEKAKQDHADRLKRILDSQTAMNAAGARGVPDLDSESDSASDEKFASQRDQTTRPEVRTRTRGEARS